jgi:hypothetical protein
VVELPCLTTLTEVVEALRGWVAGDGDFEACARGAWLLDELNELIRARPSNSQCAERAVQGYDTKGTETLTSTKVAVLHGMREAMKRAGAVAKASPAPAAAATAAAAAAASAESGGGGHGAAATGAAAPATSAAAAAAMSDGDGMADAEEELSAIVAPAEEDKRSDAETPGAWIGTGFRHKGGPRRRALATRALAKAGITAVLRALGAQGARLRDPAYRRRVRNTKEAAEAGGADLHAMEAAARASATAKEKEAVAAWAANARCQTFGESARAALASVPMSQPPVPQAATGMWNLDGKTDVDKGGQLTKAVAALECEARGLTVKRWADGTKNAGEVHSDVKLQELIKNLKTWNKGSALLKKLTDEDGNLKTGKEFAWNVPSPRASSSSLLPPMAPAPAEIAHMEEADDNYLAATAAIVVAAGELPGGGGNGSPVGSSPARKKQRPPPPNVRSPARPIVERRGDEGQRRGERIRKTKEPGL